MVMIDRMREAEETLEETVQASGMEQVLAAHHMGNALTRVIHHRREVITGRHVFACQDDVAPCGRVANDSTGFSARAGPDFGPGQWRAAAARVCTRRRRSHVEAQREWIAGILASPPLARRQPLGVA